jgi:hypothetical protein
MRHVKRDLTGPRGNVAGIKGDGFEISGRMEALPCVPAEIWTSATGDGARSKRRGTEARSPLGFKGSSAPVGAPAAKDHRASHATPDQSRRLDLFDVGQRPGFAR